MASMTVPARVHLITLGVTELARSIAFYEGLGWRQSPFSVEGDVAFFLTSGTVLALWGRDKLAADAGIPDAGDRSAFSGVAFAINLESESDVDRALAEAAAAGGTILKRAAPTFYGGYAGYFADPDGYPWEIAYNPGIPFAADGSLDLPQ
jgi:catechol 2,3-dioxygenase-like lactoylglutathione lyase family enzyme